MKICNKCETINADKAEFCSRCGASLGASINRNNRSNNYQQQQYQQQQYQQQPQYRQPQYQQQQYQQQPQYQQPQYQQPQYQQQQYQQQPQYQQQQYQQNFQSSNISFTDAIRICLKEKYSTFNGRAKRSEFWYFSLFVALIYFAFFIVIGFTLDIFSNRAAFGHTDEYLIYIFFILLFITFLYFLFPMISVTVRRLHDIGKSGWWYWIGAIPYIGGLILLIFYCLDSQKRDNEYGPYID